jgi:hypothetical protein
MNELNQAAASAISRGLVLLHDAQLTMLGGGVIQVAEAIQDLANLHNALVNNSFQLISLEQEAGPDPEEAAEEPANVAADE